MMTLHDGAGEFQPDVVYDMVAGWSRMLSADEMRRAAVEPSAIVNRNARVSYDGALDEGDMLVLDSRLRTATLFDRSTGARLNELGKIEGACSRQTAHRHGPHPDSDTHSAGCDDGYSVSQTIPVESHCLRTAGDVNISGRHYGTSSLNNGAMIRTTRRNANHITCCIK